MPMRSGAVVPAGRARSQFDDALLAPRRRRGLGERQRRARRPRSTSAPVRAGGERLEEVRHLGRIRGAVALQEEVLGLVGGDSLGRRRR